MKKVWAKIEGGLVNVMAVMWAIALFALSFGVAFWSVRWVFRLLGVL